MDASMAANVEKLAQEIATQATTSEELNQLMRTLMSSAIQRMLDAEMDVHLGRRGEPGSLAEPEGEVAAADEAVQPQRAAKAGRNRRNGHSQKTVKGDMGELRLEIPRDRHGSFEPQLIPKHQRRIPGFDEKILALYAKGMTTRDIQDVLRELYGVEVSATLIATVTSEIDQEVTAWRTRTLAKVWPIVYFDGIVTNVRGIDGRVSRHTIYVAIGVNLEGRKELIGLWVSNTEGAKFWLSVLTDMKNRGVEDIFVACIDGLAGFAEAIHAAFPDTKVQLCVVHLVRAALRYVAEKDSKAVARDLKKIYSAPTLAEAEQALDEFAQAWDEKYPTISKSWRAKWADIITLFDFPEAIRKAISTTNVIESVNSVIRKRTRNRKLYPSEDAAIKHIYIAINEASKKWTMPIPHWRPALNHFAILFEGRMSK